MVPTPPRPAGPGRAAPGRGDRKDLVTRTRRFIGGLFFGYANQAVLTLVGLWLTAFLLRKLGQEDYGLWLVGTQIVGYLGLLDLGVVALVPREIAFATGRAQGAEHADDLGEIVGRTVRLVLWQMPAVATVGVVIWLLLPAEWATLREPLAVVIAVFVLGFPLRILQAVLSGLQDLAFVGAAHTGAWAVGTATTIGLVFAGWGLYALALGWAVTQGVSALLWFVRLRSRYPQAIPTAFERYDRATLKDRLARSGWISISQVAQVLLYGTELLIIGKLMGLEAVVPYFCTAKVLTVLGHQAQMFAQTAGPGLSELRVAGNRDDLARACGALALGTLLVSGLIVCVVIVVNQGFVTWWVGADRFGGTTLTFVLLAAMLLRHWNVTALYSLFAFARDRRISLTTLADGIVSVGSTIVLVTRYGLLGAAIGTATGAVLVSLPLNLTGLAGELQQSFGSFLSVLARWAWRFTLLAALSIAVASVWVPHTVPLFVVGTLAVTAVYGLVMLPVALRAPVGIYFRPRLERILVAMGLRGSTEETA